MKKNNNFNEQVESYKKHLRVHSKKNAVIFITLGATLLTAGGLTAGHFAYKAAHAKPHIVFTSYVVTFDADGGYTPITKLQVEKGKYITNPPTATRDGFDFLGWYEEGKEERFDFKTTKIEKDISLIAKWDVPVSEDGLGFVKNSDGSSYSVYAASPSKLRNHVKIPKTHDGVPVTSIGQYDPETGVNYSFANCNRLETVEFEENSNIKYIDYNAFSNCAYLTGFKMPDSLTYIGDSAFNGCASLNEITFNNKILEIGDGAFSNCTSLESVSLPKDLVKLGDNVFSGCTTLNTVNLNDGIFTIGKETFYNCTNLSNISIPCSTIKIGLNAFSNTKLDNLNILDEYSSWQDSAQTSIKDVRTALINGTEIFKKAFTDTNYGFYYLGKDSNDKYICSVTSGATELSDDITIPSTIEVDALTDDKIILNVVRIADYAFYSNSKITTVTIPESIKYIGNHSFDLCSGLTNVNFVGNSNLLNVGDFAFRSCNKLNDITLPNGLISIGDGSFYFSGITSITIPNTIQEIKDTTVTSGSTTTIYSPFHGCHSLTTIKVNGDGDFYASDSNGILYSKKEGNLNTLIKCPENAASLTSSLPNTLESIGISAFYGVKNVASITIPKNVATIDSLAFSSQENENVISEITFEADSKLTYVGSESFANCKLIKNLDLPDSLEIIGSKAFLNCRDLHSFTIPNGVIAIGMESITGCSNLYNVTFKWTGTWSIYKPSGKEMETEFDPNASESKGKAVSYLKDNCYWIKN